MDIGGWDAGLVVKYFQFVNAAVEQEKMKQRQM